MAALLPRLNAPRRVDASRETPPDTTPVLGHPITRKARIPLVLATLQAFGQIGDSEAVPYFEKLANGEGYGKLDTRIRDAARDCLPLMRTHAQHEVEQLTLLRATDSATATRDVLLRTTADSPQVDLSCSSRHQSYRAGPQIRRSGSGLGNDRDRFFCSDRSETILASLVPVCSKMDKEPVRHPLPNEVHRTRP